MKSFVPVNTPLLQGNEKKYLNQCIDTGWVSSEGPFVKQFEQDFAKKVHRQQGIAVCNGSVALELALKALDIKPGDEVIMPTFTIISCIAAVIRLGAVPVLVDAKADTWNMDVSQIEAKITDKTKAIMVVHIYGLPVDMEPVLALARQYDLKIIEDAAESHGVTYNGQPCGSFGEVSTFSFYPNKLITTGEGGMVVTDDVTIVERCQLLRNLAFTEQRFVHQMLGWNFRMSNIQAALGVAQLEQWDYFLTKKRQIGECYQQHLQEVDELQRPLAETDYAQNGYWVYGVVLKNLNISAKTLMAALHQANIGTRAFFYPMHQQPALPQFHPQSYPVAERLASQGFYLPSGLGLDLDCIPKICQTLKNIIRETHAK